MSNYSNTTALPSPHWGPPPILMTLINAAALLANLSTLLLFLRLRLTSFDVFLANLLLVNLLYLVSACPLDTLHSLYDPHWPLSDALCTVYLYSLWLFQYLQVHAHVLISVTRVWAVRAPVAYRRHATVPRAVGLCAAAWCLAHILTLPGILRDALVFRRPLEHFGCQVNVDTAVASQRYWLLFLQVQATACEAVVMVSYWLIWYTRRQRRKIRPRRSVWSHSSRDTGNVELETTPSGNEKAVADGSTLPPKKMSCPVSNGPSSPGRTLQERKASASGGPSGFCLMTLLTGSLFVCWTPNIVYFLIISFVGDGIYDLMMANAVTVLFNVQTLMDPFLFTLALSHLRTLLCP
ncbi:probable G-protein coupled receptor No18 [Paramacrobiotus metropolitanus]|uniref:probable G-protein coupled receptor No18 n=1 Tax=Paramacrobiotus metropolitanus TaxID=2943436 RepID=UPI002446511F|nr:probable G-protein coupled receptor No18 [Paramacrobiotus metropolitanus]